MKHILLFTFILLTSCLGAQTIQGDHFKGKANARLTIGGYSITGFSNDPTLADSSTIELVTEAAAKAHADTKGQIDSLVLIQDSILVAYNAAGSEVWRDTIAGSAPETDPTVPAYAKTLTGASVVLSGLITVDGSGSGLDADLLDGQSSAAFGLVASPLSQFAATTSAQLAGVISDETGTGALVFASSPAFTTPNLGTPSAAVLTNATGLPIVAGTTGTLTVARGGTNLSTLGTANQLLRVNAGATALEYFTPAYSTISGLTTNYVTKATSSTAIGNSIIFDNGTNVGIGTASPSAKLQIEGSITTSPVLSVRPTNTASSKASFEILNSSSQKVLQVWDNPRSTLGIFGATLGSSSALSVYDSQDSNNSAYLAFIIDQSVSSLGYSGATFVSHANGTGTVLPLNFSTNNVRRMVISTSGNVGIANINPSESLDVTGSIRTSISIKLADGTAAAPSYTFTNDLNTGIYRPTSDVLAWSTNGVERGRISSSGLQLGTAGATQGNLLLSGATSGTVTVTGAAAAGTWTLTLPTSAGTSGQALTTNGSGVTSWSNVIAGTAAATRVAFGDGTNSLSSNANFTYGSNRLEVANSASAGLRSSYSLGSVYTDLGTNSAGYGYVSPTGERFGVNNISPIATLDVYNNGTETQNLLSLNHQSSTMANGAEMRINFQFAGSSMGKIAAIKETTGYAVGLFSGTGGSVNSTPGLVVLGSNLVGLATAAPTIDLGIGGNSNRTIGMERHTTANTAGNNLVIQSGGATSGATDKTGGNLNFYTGISTGTGGGVGAGGSINFATATPGSTGTGNNFQTTKMTIQNDGAVGIGTVTPDASAILDVTSTTGGILFPRMTTTQRDAISGPDDGLVIYNSTTSKLQVRAGGAWVDLH